MSVNAFSTTGASRNTLFSQSKKRVWRADHFGFTSYKLLFSTYVFQWQLLCGEIAESLRKRSGKERWMVKRVCVHGGPVTYAMPCLCRRWQKSWLAGHKYSELMKAWRNHLNKENKSLTLLCCGRLLKKCKLRDRKGKLLTIICRLLTYLFVSTSSIVSFKMFFPCIVQK